MASNNLQRFGPDNPHPLSTRKTELVWEGKYDEYGNRREVDIAGCSMPLQKIETIDEPRSRAEAQGKLFDSKKSHPDDFRNMLIWGDNKLVMASLLKDFKGKVDLIYIDPPFDVGADFTMDVPLGDENETVEKDQSTLEMVAYRDMWGRGTDSYLHMLYERLTLMKELLSETGSIYVHCDWRVTHYMRSVLEDIFGETFLNEIIWRRITSHSDARKYGQVHDTIYWFSKGQNHSWIPQFRPYSQEYMDRYFRFKESDGRRYWKEDATGAGSGPARRFGENVIPPPRGRHWRWNQETIDKYWQESRFVLTKSGKPEFKRYLDQQEGEPVGDIWDDIKRINMMADERLGYDTQKPEALLERIIRASSEERQLVGDFFCGSGTTGTVAERMGRRWIMCDLGRFAIHTSRKRLIDLQRKLHEEAKPYRAFDVYNLGRYERQWWQREHLKGADDEHRKVVLAFYKAEPVTSASSPLLHGRKGPALVHVDSIDSVFSRVELVEVTKAAKEAGAKQINCLAWEFEMDLRLEAHRLQADLGIEIHLLRIPREIMEKNRKEVTFFEVATLEAEPIYKKNGKARKVDIKLKKFLPSLAEVPEKELEALEERAIKHGFDFIDFWAVDFDYKDGQPFKHHWQAYRTRKDRSLPTVSDQEFSYEKPGRYVACVKVVDTFGCDTSITIPIEI
jgi:adenine-specific DNA-methyltransferase